MPAEQTAPSKTCWGIPSQCKIVQHSTGTLHSPQLLVTGRPELCPQSFCPPALALLYNGIPASSFLLNAGITLPISCYQTLQNGAFKSHHCSKKQRRKHLWLVRFPFSQLWRFRWDCFWACRPISECRHLRKQSSTAKQRVRMKRSEGSVCVDSFGALHCEQSRSLRAVSVCSWFWKAHHENSSAVRKQRGGDGLCTILCCYCLSRVWMDLQASSTKSWSFLLLCYLLFPLSCFVLQSRALC